MAGIDNLATNQPHDLVSHEAMHQLALDVGLMGVMRWKPRMVRQTPPTHDNTHHFPLLSTAPSKV